MLMMYLFILVVISNNIEKSWRTNVKITKVKLVHQEATFLGMHLSATGWNISKNFIDTIRQIKSPTNNKQLLSFIGLCI